VKFSAKSAGVYPAAIITIAAAILFSLLLVFTLLIARQEHFDFLTNILGVFSIPVISEFWANFNAPIFSTILTPIFSMSQEDRIKTFVIMQILTVAATSITVFLTLQAPKLQKSGMEEIREDLKTPRQLAALLTICEKQSDLEEKTLKLIKRAKDTLEYSLPKVGNIAKSQLYEQIVSDCDKIYAQITSDTKEDLDNLLNKLNTSLTELALSLKK